MKFLILITVFFNIYLFCLCCDIFIASKCPPPPGPTGDNFNWTLYCNEAKGHVDCINSKLKMCKNIQEFGPALETIKWNVKVIIEQGRSHGCTELSDKIKLPRLPRKKPPTTKNVVTEPILEYNTEYIDPNCNRNLIDKYCDRQEPLLDKYLFEKSEIFVEDFNICKKITKFNQCLQKNFRMNCYEALFDIFKKIEKSVFKCASKVKSNSANVKSNAFKTNPLVRNTMFFIFILFIRFNFS